MIAVTLAVYHQVSSVSAARARQTLEAYSRAARSIYEKRSAELLTAAHRVADEVIERAIVGGANERDPAAAWARLQDMLPRAQNEMGLDFLLITDATGRVVARHNDRPSPTESVSGPDYKNPLMDAVMTEARQRRNSPAAAAVVEQGEFLVRVGLDRIAQVPRDDGSKLDEALMIEAAVPIFVAGRLAGAVLIGQLVNNLYKTRPGASSLQTPLVAEIRQTIFRGSDVETANVGGGLVSLGDTIISSSVPVSASSPNTGAEVALRGLRRAGGAEQVLGDQNGQYRVAWQPIKSLDGTAIGSVGVAVPADEQTQLARGVATAFLIVGVIGALVAGFAGYLAGRLLGSRLNWLTDAAGRMSVGELGTPIADLSRPLGRPPLGRPWFASMMRDEISRLAEQMDEMRESFKQAIERLRKR
jgi:HAMP domain-containing protein